VLELLRWASQIRSWSDLNLPSEGSGSATMSERELSMAVQLVDAMSASWEPDKFKDQFTAQVMATVEEKVKTGKITEVVQPEVEKTGEAGADIIDFTELLRRSLQRKNEGQPEKQPAKPKAAAKRP
jgi:DNA end-binding protein Ku